MGQGTVNSIAKQFRESQQEETFPDQTGVVHDINTTHYQWIQALIDELSMETTYSLFSSVIGCFRNSLTHSIQDQIKAEGPTLSATMVIENIKQLDTLSSYVQHDRKADNKIRKDLSHCQHFQRSTLRCQ
jgi:hypothetical protein